MLIRAGFVLVACSSAAMAAPPAFHAAVEGDGPSLWYRFDEESGSTAFNHGSLGQDFNATYFSGPSLGAATLQGDTGGCYNASTQPYLESDEVAPGQFLVNPTFSCEAVVALTASQPSNFYAPFLHWGGAATGKSVYFSLFRSSPDKMYVGFYNGGMRMVGTFQPLEWNHFVWTRDSAGGMADAQSGNTLYVNGQPVALENDDSLPGVGIPGVTATTFRVQRATDSTRYFSGVVDEVVLYDHVLTAEEAKAHFGALLGGATRCRGDFNGDGRLNINDFIAMQHAFALKDTRADLNHDCALNINDFISFQAAFRAGCP